jgi:quercetin dioxygenase-like cupin family protein
MTFKSIIGLLMAVFLLAVGLPAGAQEDEKAPKAVTARGLVTSLGGFSATVNAPIFLTGSTIELAPGGRTGRQQFRVPTYVYVIEGILTTQYEAGPVGIAGTQYHAAGQSFMDNGGWWHIHFNRSDKPTKYLILHIGYPGRPDPIVKPEAD